MTKKKAPEGLIESRPGLEHDPSIAKSAPEAVLGNPPAKYTTAVHESIVNSIREGNRPHVAAGIAGITPATFYDWMKRGASGDPHLYQFAQDVELAKHVAEGEAVKVLKAAFKDDPDAAKWWLERARSDGYSKQVKTLVESQIEEFMKRLEEGLPPEIFEMVLAIYAGQTPATPPEEKPPAVH
jgi:hypothetical protein